MAYVYDFQCFMFSGDTNKKQISSFIIESIREFLPEMYNKNENELFAHVALWEFVGMLLKQNGVSRNLILNIFVIILNIVIHNSEKFFLIIYYY